MFNKHVVVDGRGHLLGKLAARVAKELLSGQRIVVVRCEEINISGSLFRNKLKYHDFLRKRTNTNPRRGPFHLRAPAKIFWRTVRGMIPHKTARGAEALGRLKSYEGIPAPFDKVKRCVIPMALKINNQRKVGRKTCSVGELSTHVGWKYAGVVKTLEERRKVRAAAFYQVKSAYLKLRSTARSEVLGSHASNATTLRTLGY